MRRRGGPGRGWLWLSATAVWLLLVTARPASAHMMPAQQGTVNVLDDAAYVVLSLPVSAVPGVDDDGDGRLSPAEASAHEPELRAALASRVRLTDGGSPGRVEFVQVSADPDERSATSSAGSAHFLVLMKIGFATSPRALRLAVDLWGHASADRQLTIKAVRGRQVEVVVMTPGHRVHGFFRSPWQVFAGFVRVGIDHILGGADHLLFLITVLIAAGGWRYRAWAVTTFTAAHCITLVLTQLDWLRVSPGLVEPLIAASIVAMAVVNLLARATSAAHRLPLVFGCGLLHGLGFASAVDVMGVTGGYRVASILGFNLGIELGQAVFILGVLGLATVSRALLHRAGLRLVEPWLAPRSRSADAVSALAAAIGLVWLVQRLPASW